MSTDEGSDSTTCRVFIAVSLPGHVKDEIERVQEQLRSALSGRCVRSEDRLYHSLWICLCRGPV